MRGGRSVGFLRPARLGTAAALAIGLAAGVSGWRYWHDTAAGFGGARPIATTRLAAASADLFRLVPETEDRRPHAPYPLEFERQFPLIAALPASDPVPTLPPAPPPAAAKASAAGLHHECAPRCGATLALVAPLPPRRPEALRATPAPEPTAVAEAEEEPRLKIMSVPALPFLPAGRAVLRKVADLGTGLTASVGEFLDATR